MVPWVLLQCCLGSITSPHALILNAAFARQTRAGTIPATISALTALEGLYMDGTSISGTSHPLRMVCCSLFFLGSATSRPGDGRHQRNSAWLTHVLHFAPCCFIPVGTIPADIGKLTKLSLLNLHTLQALSGECAKGPVSASQPL